MSNEELAEVLKERLQGIKPFELKLGGISKQEDSFGNYLFLNVLQSVDDTFSTIVKKVSVEMIADKEESIIIIESELV